MVEVVYLGLGSNLGDKKAYLDAAVDSLSENPNIDVEKVSTFFATKAISSVNQPDFLNAVCCIKTILTPYELLALTQSIELKYGRQGKGQYDPRTLDIDILFYGDQIVSDDDLIIPHPMLHLRAFVLHPLFQVAPDFIHPSIQEPVSELYHSYIQVHGTSL